MYLIGIMIWVLVVALIAWLLARLLTRRAKTRWWTGGLALLLLPVIVMATLADEIVGKFSSTACAKKQRW